MTKTYPLKQFPKQFTWGIGTSAYQIEGAAKEDGRGESIWDRFSHTPGKIANNQNGDIATDHYHRYQEDINILSSLSVDAYRFSISWPRILPNGQGRIEKKGLDFYNRLIDNLLQKNITPWITLYHWDLPQILEDQGGWPNRKTADYFANFVEIVTRRLGDRVKNWITINEPYCAGLLSYYEGIQAPGKKDLKAALSAIHTLLLAHGKAIPIIRSNSPGAQVGIVTNNSPVYPADEKKESLEASIRFDGILNRWFLDPIYKGQYPEDIVNFYQNNAPKVETQDMEIIARKTDFLGINYYSPAVVKNSNTSSLKVKFATPKNTELTAMGWIIYPQGLYEIVKRIASDYPIKKIYITENGAAFVDKITQKGSIQDTQRTKYLEQHLLAVSMLIKNNAPIKGYFAWTLADNFEWSEGFSRRFGLIYTDFKTQKRTIKQSGYKYKEVIEANK